MVSDNARRRPPKLVGRLLKKKRRVCVWRKTANRKSDSDERRIEQGRRWLRCLIDVKYGRRYHGYEMGEVLVKRS